MPTPTRSHSLREPARQPPSSARAHNTSKSISTTTKPSVQTTTASSKTSNSLTRRKSTVSRSATPHNGQTTTTSRGGSQQESRLPQRGTSQQKPPPKSQDAKSQQESSITCRRTLIRPTAIKTDSSARVTSPTKTTLLSPALSARKEPVSARETVQKKTDMPPPPRPTRSASLKQPAKPNTATSASVRGHTRHRSQFVTPVTAQPAKRADTTVPALQRPAKTQFTTYQQHYSPKKQVKPSVSTPAGGDVSLIPSSWPEVSALQTELLQLSLLHSESKEREAVWQAQSEGELREKYNAVAQRYRSVQANEQETQRRLNARALDLWARNVHEHGAGDDFSGQIQLLSQIAQEISDLSDDGGRYTLAIRTFEDWYAAAEEIKESRSQYTIPPGAAFIDPLDSTWKEELDTLNMKFERCSRQLHTLIPDTPADVQDSALCRMVNGLKDTMGMMMSEVNAIRLLEEGIIRSERVWVGRLAEKLGSVHSRTEPGSRVGIWKQGVN